jgi:hypothetical protein
MKTIKISLHNFSSFVSYFFFIFFSPIENSARFVRNQFSIFCYFSSLFIYTHQPQSECVKQIFFLIFIKQAKASFSSSFSYHQYHPNHSIPLSLRVSNRINFFFCEAQVSYKRVVEEEKKPISIHFYSRLRREFSIDFQVDCRSTNSRGFSIGLRL